MRKIREVLRLCFEHKMIARGADALSGLSCTSVLEYGYRAKAPSLKWHLPEGMSDEGLEALRFPLGIPQDTYRPLPVRILAKATGFAFLADTFCALGTLRILAKADASYVLSGHQCARARYLRQALAR